jgi:hypothetical protein
MNLSDQIITSVVTVATAIIGVAIIAVLVSKQSQTTQVLGAAGNALATDLRAALSPVSGSGIGLGGISFTTPSISFQ